MDFGIYEVVGDEPIDSVVAAALRYIVDTVGDAAGPDDMSDSDDYYEEDPAIHEAYTDRNFGQLFALLLAGADIEAKDTHFSVSILYRTAEKREMQLAQLLIAAKADANSKVESGNEEYGGRTTVLQTQHSTHRHHRQLKPIPRQRIAHHMLLLTLQH
jgi:hypothetical protein